MPWFNKMRRVLIGTPCYDGRTDVWYNDSLNRTIRMAIAREVQLDVVYMCYDSLVQRARNDIVKLAIENKFDDLVFIDSDQGWEPEAFFKLLDHPVHVVGMPVPKKSDAHEVYNVRINDIENFKQKFIEGSDLIEVDGVGTGMLRLSHFAFVDLWTSSAIYRNEGRECRMVFDVQIVDGDLVSEDNVACTKLKKLGYKIYVDRSMTCSHVGVKKWTGDFNLYLQKQLKRSGA